MGADAFFVYFGLKFTINSVEEMDRFETRDDSRLEAARKARLKWATGRLTDGEKCFLLIGHEFGRFGVENLHEALLSEENLYRVLEETKQKFVDAGFRETPMLIFQLNAQY